MGRRKEIGVRLALGREWRPGASTGAVRNGGAGRAGRRLGLLVAQAAVQLIVAYFGKTLPETMAVRLDCRCWRSRWLLSLATGIVVGAGAAWRLTRTNVSDALKQGLSRTDADDGGTQRGPSSSSRRSRCR